MEWADGKRALAHVEKTLGDPDHEEGLLVSVVVAGQLSEELSQSGVVGSGTEKTHGKDGVDSYIVVIVVTVPRQSIVDLHLWIAGAQETHCQRNSLADIGFAVVHQMSELTEDHLLTNVFTHSYQTKTNYSVCL